MKKGTFVAVGVFAVLLVAYLATRETQVSVGVKKLELPAIEKTKIQELSLSGPKNVVLKHDAAGWKVEDPAKPGLHPADDGQVTSLVDAFADTKYQDMVSDRAEKLAELEVDDSKGLKVKAVVEGLPKPVELVFGKAARGGAYVRQPGKNEVFLAEGRFSAMARRDANSWRKHAMLSVKADDVTSLDIKPKDGNAYTLKRGADNAWALENPPPGFRFDPSAGQRMAQQLASLSAQDFQDAPASDADLGLAGAHDVVEAKLKDDKTVAIHFGSAPPVATDAGVSAPPPANAPVATRVDGDSQIYLVAPFTRGELTKAVDGMRDLTLFTFDAAKAKKLEIHGAKPVVVAKEGESWKVVEPKQVPADFDATQVPAQLSRIRSLRAARWLQPAVPEAQAGLAKAATVTVTLEDGTKQSLVFGKDIPGQGGAKQLYVKGAADKAIYAVAEFEKTRFDTGVDLFKKPPPMPNFAGGPGGGIKGLENLPPDVRRQLEAQLRQRGGMPGQPPFGRR